MGQRSSCGCVLSLGIFLAVLGAAFLHALWNALIKLGTSKVGGMVILSIVEVPIAACGSVCCWTT